MNDDQFSKIRYHLQEEIGRSKMCVAYKAYDSVLQRSVVISTIQESLQGNTKSKQMFSQTARIIAQFRHPNVVPLYNFVYDDGFYMITEFISGQTLERKIAEAYNSKKTLPLKESLGIFHVVCEAVEYIHSHKIIHGDLQPENIIIDHEGKPILIGFGYAELDEVSGFEKNQDKYFNNPAYVAPEILKDGKISPLSDIYSLGVILYEMITGALPFQGETPEEIIAMHDKQTLPNFNPNIPKSFVNIISKSLAKNPEDRYQSAKQMATDLSSELVDRRTLKDILVEYFNSSEIRSLLFDLGIDNDLIPGEDKRDKIQELIGYMERHYRTLELIQIILKHRPNIHW